MQKMAEREVVYVYTRAGEPMSILTRRGEEDGGWRGRSGYLSRWREDGRREKGGWGIAAKMTVCEFNEREFGKTELGVPSAGKITRRTERRHNGTTEFMIVVLCVCAIRWGKHCDISRPSYSNQKIKVPFFPAVATNLDQPHVIFLPPSFGTWLSPNSSAYTAVGVTAESRIWIFYFSN